MNLASYLYKRPGSAMWQLRWMVPLAARTAVGRSEFTRSLGTTDRREAEARAYPILSEWRAQVDKATNQTIRSDTPVLRVATGREIDDELARFFEEQHRVNEFMARADLVEDRLTFADKRARVSASIELLQERAFLGADFNILRWFEGELEKRALAIPEDDNVRAELNKKAARAFTDAIAYLHAKLNGREDDFKPASFIIDARRERIERQNRLSLNEAFERYAAQRLAEGAKKLDGINQDRIVVHRFEEFVGSPSSVAAVTRTDVREWRDALSKLPRNFTNSNVFRGMTMREASMKAASMNVPPISPTTLNKYLSTVSPLFNWAVQNGYAETNPFEGLFLKIDKQSRTRPPFSADELGRMFNSPLFRGFERSGKEYRPGTVIANDWRKWIPLIALYTGSRIGEIAQLRRSDLRNEHGRWFVDIKHDPANEQSTKSKRSRIVPLHRDLLKMGVIDFLLMDRNEALNDRLFAELTSNVRGQIGATPSRFWRNYLTRIGVKEGADGKGAHSFRHTLADELRSAGFLDEQFGPLILGHRKASVTAGYGRLPQGTAETLCAMIDAVKFKGLDIAHLLRAPAGTP